MYMVTRLRYGLKLFSSLNWTTEPSLVQRFHSGSREMLCVQGVPVLISMGKNVLDVEDKNKTPSTAVFENEWSCTSNP